MGAELQEYRFTISLRLVHPSAELSHCSAELGLEALRLWKAGEPRETPQGKPLEGFWRESYWTATLDTPEPEGLEAALARIADWLGEHASFLSNHARSGGSAELFIGFFLEGANSGFLLEPSLIEKYSALGVALAFDIFGFDDESGAL